MSDREDRLKALLNKVRAKRPDERATHAADVLERIRTALLVCIRRVLASEQSEDER